MDHTVGSTYCHSGRFPLPAPLAIVLVTGLVGALAGAVYGVLVLLIPLIYVNFIGTCGLGFLIGWLTLKLSVAMKVRNTTVVTMCGLTAGLLSLHAAWVGWVFALSDYEVIVLSPSVIYTDLAPVLAEDGVWGLSSDLMVRGWMLYGVWVIEATIIIGFATVYPAKAVARMPFDETQQSWANQGHVLPSFKALDPDQQRSLRERLLGGDWEPLLRLQPADDTEMSFTQLTVLSSDPSSEVHFVTIRSAHVFVDSDGSSKSQSTDIVRNLIIDNATREALIRLGEYASSANKNQSASLPGEARDSIDSNDDEA